MPPTRLHADEVHIDESVARRLIAEQLPQYAAPPLHRVASGAPTTPCSGWVPRSPCGCR